MDERLGEELQGYYREILRLKEQACVTVQQALPGVELTIYVYPNITGDREELRARGLQGPLAQFFFRGEGVDQEFVARVCPLGVEVVRRALFIRGEEVTT